METKLGPWPLGLDNLSEDTDLPEGALRAAEDVCIDPNGTVNSAAGPALASPLPGAADVWTSLAGSTYARVEDQLHQVESGDFYGALGDGPFAFADHLGGVIVSTHSQIFQVGQAPAVRPLALPAPSFQVRSTASGGLDAGRYGVAACALRGGEEFGLSAVQFVEVPQGGGLLLDISGLGDLVRVFRTSSNGTQLYRAVDAPSGMPDYLLGAGKLGSEPTGRFLEPMPGGHLLASWNGRVLCARGRNLNFSQPLRPALYDPRHDFIPLPGRITMVAPLPDGIYLSTRHETFFLNGTDPATASLIKLSASPPPEGCFAVLQGGLFTEIDDTKVAVWLSAEGFVLGLPGGQVVRPQVKRLRLSRPEHGSLVLRGTRLFALAH